MTITSQIHIGLAAWQQNHVYTAGNRISNDTAPAKAYVCTVGGTSQNLTNAGPKGTSPSTDGTVQWKYLSQIDYTSAQSWWNGIGSTASDNIFGSFWNDGPITTTAGTNYIYDTGITTGSFTITIGCAPGESFRDKTGSLPLAINSSNGVTFVLPGTTAAFPLDYFRIITPNVIFDGIQFQDPNSTSNCSIIGTDTGATSITIRNCILDGYGQASGGAILYFQLGFKLYNTLIIDRTVSPGQTTIQTSSVSGVVFQITNCVVVSVHPNTTGGGLLSNPASPSTVKNSIWVGYTTPLINGLATSTLTVSNTAFDIAPATGFSSGFSSGFSGGLSAFPNLTDGGGNQYSITPANDFVALYTDFRSKLTSPLAGLGVVDTTDIPAGDDIFRNLRGSSWDIGVTEVVPTSKGQIPAISASAIFTRGYIVNATVQLPTVRAAVNARQTLVFSSADYVNSLSAVIIATQNKGISALVTIPTLRVASTARLENLFVAGGREWSNEFSNEFGPFGNVIPSLTASGTAVQNFTNNASATISIPAIRAAVQAALGNGFLALGKLVLSAKGTMQNPVIFSGTGLIPTIRAAATAYNYAPATAQITITTMSAVAIANLAANVASATISIPAVQVISTAKQDDLFSATVTFAQMQAKTAINFVTAKTNINNLASASTAGQSNTFSAISYIPGISCVAGSNIAHSATANVSVNVMSAVVTGYLSDIVIAGGRGWSSGFSSGFGPLFNITIPSISCVAVATQANVARAACFINLNCVATARQEQYASSLSYITFMTSVGLAGGQNFYTARVSIPGMAASAQFVMGAPVSGLATIPIIRATSTARQENLFSEITTLGSMSSVATFGQLSSFTESSTIPTISASGLFSQQLVWHLNATIPTVTASVVAGQGNVITGNPNIPTITAKGAVSNALAATGVATVPTLSTIGVFGNEDFFSGNAFIPGMATVIRAVQFYSLTATVNIPPITVQANAAATENVTATVSIPTITANGIAYRGWIGTATISIPSITASASAMQTTPITGTNTIQMSAAGVFKVENLFNAIAFINVVTCNIQASNGVNAAGLATIPTITAKGTVAATSNVTGLATINLLVSAIFNQSVTWSSTNTLTIDAEGGVYSTPPQGEESEDVVFWETDDRIVYVTE